MTFLSELYERKPVTFEQEIAAFIESPKHVDEELEYLNALLSSQSYEKIQAIFLIETLSQTLRKQQDFTKFIVIVLGHVESNLAYKNSILILRIIKTVINTRFFLPTGFYLTRLLGFATEVKRPVRNGKDYTYDCIRLRNEDLQSEELQLFVARECLGLIRKQVAGFGASIGFPEYAFVVCNELRSKCKIGEFREVVAGLIKNIMDRKTYIEEMRAKEKVSVLNGKAVATFEQKLEPWNIDG